MSDTVIRIENLSKQYRLGKISGKTLRDDLSQWWARRRGKPNPLAKVDQHHLPTNGKAESIWALKDVSFEVKRGEVLGVIGRNGAGKSTLLKILSLVTSPTSGQVRVRGRIASLLEVGTGFHPELTGRENIFLNGAILGMTKAEIRSKFDEIVVFAETEKFIDTPVKRYSSGMYVRLAFAVAAHLEPEILIVDEVLAVGDIGFQKKCFGKIREIGREGRTILMVSHNMSSVSALCPRVIWLDGGQINKDGSSEMVISAYQESLTAQSHILDDKVIRLGGAKGKYIEWIQICDDSDTARFSFSFSEYINLKVRLHGEIPPSAYIEWEINSLKGHRISSGGSFMVNDFKITDSDSTIVCRIGPLSLAQGEYQISIKFGVLPGQLMDAWEDAFRLRITSCDPLETGLHFDSRRGDIYISASYHKV